MNVKCFESGINWNEALCQHLEEKPEISLNVIYLISHIAITLLEFGKIEAEMHIHS